MRHEIQCEIYCGAESVIVRGTGSTVSTEDRRSPEASRGTELSWPETCASGSGGAARLSAGSSEPIWGDECPSNAPQGS